MTIRLTPAEIAGIKGQLLVGQTIVEIDPITRVPTGNMFTAGAAGTAPTPVGGTAQAAVASAPDSLTGTGAIALTYALHAGKNLHAEPGQTSLTIADTDWASDGELSIINHTGGNLPVVLGAGVNGFVNRADGDDVVGPATLIVLAYLERATIQMKGAGAFCNVAVMGGSGSFERAWATGVAYEAGEIVRATVASGAIGIGDRIACQTTHVAAASFATDIAKWSELPDDPDAVLLAGAQTIIGVKTFSVLPELSVAATTNNQPIRKGEHDTAMALKANLASPSLTGTPTAPTAAANTNTTQVATTAFVQSEIAADLATATPLMDGAAAVGTATKMAREDHRHPTDTTRAPLASPAFTGDVSVTDTAAGVGPVLKLENNNYALADKGQIVFEHGSSQNAQAIIQSNLPGSNDIDLEFYTTNNAVLNATPALKLTGDNGVVLAAALPITQGGTGSTSAAAALTALGASSSASPTFTGTVTVDGTVKLGNGHDVGSATAVVTDVTNVYAPVASTATTTIATSDTVMRLARSGTSGTKWNNVLDVNIGSHTAGLNSQTQVDFRLNNGAVGTPDMTALTLKGNGEVLANGSQVVRQADVINTLVSTSTTAPLSAAQGKALQDGKQARTVYTTSTDANNLVSPGVHVSGNGAGQLGNGPTGAAAWEVRVAVMAVGVSTYIHQLYLTDNNDMWNRKRDSGTTWSAWSKILNGSVAQSEVTGLTAALAAKQDVSEKNVANGYAGLDANSKILAAQLPSLATTTTTSLAPLLGVQVGLPGYRRAKLIPVNSIAAGSGDYQVYLRVGESAGAAANDLHLGGNSQNFPSAQKLGGELKFVLPDGTDVPFFVANVTGTTPNRVAHCYLRLSGLTGGAGVQKLVFMLYDNNVLSVTNQMSVITAVFDLLADDFDGASVDTGKWTPTNLGATPSGGVLTFGGGSVARSLNSLASFGDNIEMLSRQRLSDTGASYSLHGWNQAGADAFLLENGWDSATRMNNGGVLTTLANGLNHGPGERDFIRIGRSGGSGRFISTSPANSNTFTSVPTVSGPLRVYNTYDNTAEIDWVAVRQYFATEPAMGTVQDV